MSEISRIDINNVNYALKDVQARASASSLSVVLTREQAVRLSTSVVGGRYNSTNRTIELLNASNTVVSSINANAFIKDGMVSDVSVSNGNLVITFNTDAGKSPIVIPLTAIFDPQQYFNKEEVNAKIGYYVCSTNANVAAKTVDATGFILGTGGSIKIKMTSHNTAADVTLNINNTGAKPLYYAGLRASSANTWESGETIEVYYDGTNYMANNVAGGGGDGVFDVSAKTGNTYESLSAALTAMNDLPSAYKKGGMSIKYVQSTDNKYVQYRLMKDEFSTTESDWQGVDNEPTAGSEMLVKSGGVATMVNRKLNSIWINGADNTYKSTRSYDFIGGHKYVLNINSWNGDGITPSGYVFLVTVRANGISTEVIQVISYNSLQSSYEIEVPEGVEYVTIGGRIKLGTIGVIAVEDITRFDGLETVANVDAKLAKKANNDELTGTANNSDEGVMLNPQAAVPTAEKLSSVSDYIPVTQYDEITTHPGFETSPSSFTAYICGYDSAKNFVSGQYWNVSREDFIPERTFTISNDSVRFVRMTFNRFADVAFVKVNGVKAWEYQKIKAGVYEYGIKNTGLTKEFYAREQYKGWMSGYVTNNNGSQSTSSVNSCTGYIDIEGYEEIEVVLAVTKSESNASVCFYEEDGTFIKGYPPRTDPSLDEGTFEVRYLSVPANAKYCRCSLYTRLLSEWYLMGIKKPKIQLSSLLKKQKVTMEFGNLDANGQMKPYSSDFFDNARTSLYYKLQSINLPYSYKIYVFSSSYSLIDIISAQANTEYNLDANNWYKITINYTENSLPIKEIVLDLDVIDKSYNIITPKTIKTFQYLVKYKKGRGLYEDGNSAYSEAYNMGSDLISNTIRVFLPSNYSPTGEPVKVIYKAHGSNGYSWINLDTWGGDSSIDYLADEGFALYDMFAGTSYYSAIINPHLVQDSTTRIANYNIPIQLAAQVAAYEWFVRNFNVAPRVYVFGKSHGGMAGIYATNKIIPTRAVALFAPLITPIGDLYRPWGNHENECSMCLDDMCFDVPDGMTFEQMVSEVSNKATGWKTIMLNNIRQQSGLNAYLNGITNVKQSALLSALMDDTYKVQGGMDELIRHSETPVKIWCALDDAEVVFANGWNFIKSLQNGGSNAQFREFPTGTGGHYFDSFTDSLSIKDTVTTALGVQYTAPRAYIELVNFFHQF